MNDIRPDELISVIVPAWNAERYLARTLESIENQTYRNFEVIIIDDGSTDRTSEIARQWASKDTRFHVLQKANGGVASARNAGIEVAKGCLIAPCDADDLWSPRKLEKHLAAWRAAGPKVGLVYSWSVEIDENDVIRNYSNREFQEGDVFARMFKGNLIGNGSAAMMLKQAVLDVGGYDPTLRARRTRLRRFQALHPDRLKIHFWPSTGFLRRVPPHRREHVERPASDAAIL
ncbi:MAG: glycosyltransferase family A protein [Hyphomonas sp.]